LNEGLPETGDAGHKYACIDDHSRLVALSFPRQR